MIMELPDTQYVPTDHGEIAYQVYGDGPVALVASAGRRRISRWRGRTPTRLGISSA